MGSSGVKYSARLDIALTEDSSIEDCVFDSFVWNGSGGGIFVRGSFKLTVSGCRFSRCVAGVNGGGLSVETEISHTFRNYFCLCDCYHWGSALYQNSKSENVFEFGSFLLCSVKSSEYDCFSAFMQMTGTSNMRFVNGSYLSSIARESAHHHGSGQQSFTSFVTLSSCSGPYIFSFHNNLSPAQVQENVCTTNSSATKSIAVIFNGKHMGKNFILCEPVTLISRYSGFFGSITFQNSFFGCSSTNLAWITTEDCVFNCGQDILNARFRDQSMCFMKGSIPFSWMNIEIKVAPMTVYPFSLLIITR